MSTNKICNLFNIKYPIIQAGMIWCSGWRLASTVSNEGGLGIIGAGSMYPNILREHIQKCKKATDKPFAVNLPLLYPDIDQLINIIIEEKVPIVFTSAGNPKTWTSILKENNIKVVHVVSSTKFAIKCEEAGVDAVVAEGFEAGGHNGREETTTMCLIPLVIEKIKIPLIAAGGIGCGKTMMAALNLGADAVQIGSAFVPTFESSAHENFKKKVVEANEGDTVLTLKTITPVRLIKNEFYNKIATAQENCASTEALKEILGRARAKKGMFEGDLIEGELEIGQVSASLNALDSAANVFHKILNEYYQIKNQILTEEKYQF